MRQRASTVRSARGATREARSAKRGAQSAKREARSAKRGARSAKREARGARSRPAGPAFLDRTGDSRRVHPSPLAAQGRPPTRKQARGVAPSFLSQIRGPLEVPCGPRSSSASAPTKAPKAGKSGSGLGACVAVWPRRRLSEAGRPVVFRESFRSQVRKSPGSEVTERSGDTEETEDTEPTEDTEKSGDTQESEDPQESGDLKSEDAEVRRHDARRHRGQKTRLQKTPSSEDTNPRSQEMSFQAACDRLMRSHRGGTRRFPKQKAF